MSKNPISDIDLYTHNGYYLINGGNPILMSPEVPPIGKYLIGLSILLFHNQRIVSVVFALLSLFFVYKLTRRISGSSSAAGFATLLTATHTLFIDQIIHSPQLDIIQLAFILLFLLFLDAFLKESGEKKQLLAASISAALASLTKIFLLNYLFLSAILGCMLFLKKRSLKTILKNTIFFHAGIWIVTLGSYSNYFLLTDGATLRSFFGVQKWIASFYMDSPIDMRKLYGSYLMLIANNTWRFWSEGYPVVHSQEWNITWPILFAVATICTLLFLFTRPQIRSRWLLLIIFFLGYNGYLFIVPIFPRYLLLLFVIMHILIAGYAAHWYAHSKTTRP